MGRGKWYELVTSRKTRTRGIQVGQGSGVLKGHTCIFIRWPNNTNKTCVSRATSGRLRLNDETRLRGCVASCIFTIHSLLPNRSFSFAEASAWHYVLLCLWWLPLDIRVAFATSMVSLSFSFSAGGSFREGLLCIARILQAQWILHSFIVLFLPIKRAGKRKFVFGVK